jgi:hypothetical protein
LVYCPSGTQDALMTAMNSLDRIDTTPVPILRVPETQPASESQQLECCCPELCQLDHGN